MGHVFGQPSQRSITRWSGGLESLTLLGVGFLSGLTLPAVLVFSALGAAAVVWHQRPTMTPDWLGTFLRISGRLAVVVLIIDGIWSLGSFPLWIFSVVTVFVEKLAMSAVQKYKARTRDGERVAVVGAGHIGVELANILSAHPEYGLLPVGFVDSVPPDESLPLPLLGKPEVLDKIIDDHRLSHIVIAFGAARESALVNVVRVASEKGLYVYVLPRFFELSSEGRSQDALWGYPVNVLRPPGTASDSRPLKRIFDIVTASVILLVTAPLGAMIAGFVRLSGPGPVLFRQKRIGLNGRVFELIKFRTMKINDDSDTTWSVESDGRVTPVGHVLRVTHLDEWPQLINVLRGDMSMVGPRPERPFFVDQFSRDIPSYHRRHAFPGGVTGLAQVNGLTGDTSITERVRFDNFYIENWSLRMDVAILFRTLKTLFPGRS